MNDLLIGCIVAGFFALLSLRPLTTDSRSPAEYRALARRAGWTRCLLGTARVVLVVWLLLLVEACRMCWHTAAATGFVLATIAAGVEALSQRPITSREPA